jgi:trehalose 6-phosphate phosphatase
MKHLFDKQGLAALRTLAASETLVALDYDGTLTPIREDPASAVLSAEMDRRLQGLARVLPTIIVTGRASADARSVLGDIGGIEVIGNHGAETSALIPPNWQRRIHAWREALESRLGCLPGVSVEDKGYSLSVHYRRSPDWETARCAILAAVADLPDARVTGGKAVVNVVLPEAPDKGAAVLLACRRAKCRRAIYVGDDATDEDVFALDRPDEILTVRVGGGARTLADYYLSDPQEVGELLVLLTRLRDGREARP